MVDWWKPIVLGFLLTSVGGFAWYGVANRPLVDYTLNPPGFWEFTEMTLSIMSAPVMKFDVDLRNRGLTDSVVNVTVMAWNASVAVKQDGPFSSSVSLLTPLSARSNDWGGLTFYLRPMSDTPSFRISCFAAKVADYSSFSGIVSTLFEEIKGQPPTSVLYIQIYYHHYEPKT